MSATWGWRSRGYLPHFDSEETTQSVTFRLGDSVPQEKMELWQKDPRCIHKRVLWNVVENFLDKGYGGCLLKQEQTARIVEEAILFFDSTRYKIWAWCVMPNHVHVLFEPLGGYSLSSILHSWKSFTAHEIKRGQIWQIEYFDRYIRNEEHFNRVLHYIEQNPVKAGLCTHAQDWPWSNTRFRS